MAPLNPTVQPTNSPDYRGYSNPIDIPRVITPEGQQTNTILPQGQRIGDESAAYQGKADAYGMMAEGSSQKAYGDLFKDITAMGSFLGKAGVSVVKKDIEDKVYDIADKERQQYTASLEAIKNTGDVSGVLSGSSDPSSSTPQELTDLGDTLSTLKSAKDAGKISTSYYEGRLLSDAKSLRAQYPGFRDYIDSEFAKVTGSNPANSYIHALTSDINKSVSSVASNQKKAESFVLQHSGYPKSQMMLQAVQAGKASLTDVIQWAAPYAQQDYSLQQRAAIFKDDSLSRKDKQAKVGSLFDSAAGIAVSRSVDSMEAVMGINSAEDASKLDTAVKSGLVPQAQWVQWGQQLAAHKTQLSLALNQDALKSGATTILGQDEVNKRIDAALKPIDMLIDRVYNKDIGGYYRVSQDLKSIQNETTSNLLNNPKLGPYLRVMGSLRQIGGEQNLQQFAKTIIEGDFPSDLKTYYTNWQSNFATQYSMQTTGVPVTFNDMISDLKAKGIDNPKLNVAMLNSVSKIADPTVPEAIRLNYAESAFSPQNRGMIGNLSADGVDSQGRPVTGRNAIFLKWTSPDMTKAMYDLGQKHPQIWTNYVDWAQTTLSKDLLDRDMPVIVQNPGIQIGWDDVNKRLVVSTNQEKAMSAKAQGKDVLNPALDPELHIVNMAVNRINSDLYNYKNIAKASGASVDKFLIQTISTEFPTAVQDQNSIAFQLLRSLGLAQIKR